MNNVHAPPKSEQDREQIRCFLRRQLAQVLDSKQITCACCERDFEFMWMFRCYFCGLYFCRRCAKEHFSHHPEEIRK